MEPCFSRITPNWLKRAYVYNGSIGLPFHDFRYRFELDEKGHPVKGGKRHPDVGDRVVIYAGATVLGGDTVIGKNSIIGGNVFITSSVEEGTRVSVKNQELRYDSDREVITKVEKDEEPGWFYVI